MITKPSELHEDTPKWSAIQMLFLAVLFAGAALVAPTARAAVIEEIAFEAGTISDEGTAPDASGWKFDPFNDLEDIPGLSGILPANAGRPTFANGTTQDAYVMHVFGDATGLQRDRQGIVWERAQDTGAGAPETFDVGEILYAEMEHFSDVARSNTSGRFRTQLFFGALDDGVGNAGVSGEGGFSGTPFDPDSPGFETSWQWSQENVDAGLTSAIGMQHTGTRFAGVPTPEELDLNYTTVAVFRHGSDSTFEGSGFEGTELEIRDAQGTFNGGDATNTAAGEPWGGNPQVVEGALVDKLAVFFSRQRSSGDYPEDVHSTYVSSASDVQMGIKYIKVATTSKADVNLDGTVDAADVAIVQANMGLFGPTSADFDGDSDVDGQDYLILQNGFGVGTTQPEGDADGSGTVDAVDLGIWQSEYGSIGAATHFEGDVDNDLDVDDDDLALVQSLIPPLSASTAVPEPAGIVSLMIGVIGLSQASRRLR